MFYKTGPDLNVFGLAVTEEKIGARTLFRILLSRIKIEKRCLLATSVGLHPCLKVLEVTDNDKLYLTMVRYKLGP